MCRVQLMVLSWGWFCPPPTLRCLAMSRDIFCVKRAGREDVVPLAVSGWRTKMLFNILQSKGQPLTIIVHVPPIVLITLVPAHYYYVLRFLPAFCESICATNTVLFLALSCAAVRGDLEILVSRSTRVQASWIPFKRPRRRTLHTSQSIAPQSWWPSDRTSEGWVRCAVALETTWSFFWLMVGTRKLWRISRK